MRLLVVLVAVLCVASLAAAQSRKFDHGAAPELQGKYVNLEKEFRCLDGSRVLTSDKVNDDYCDCRDGSDEPGTSACPMQKFHCKNEFAQPKTIYSSRVLDGICDCCDGSDEFDPSKGEQRKECPNTCKEEGRAYAQALIDEIHEVEEALQVARASAEVQSGFKAAKQMEKSALAAEIAKLQEELTAAETKSQAARSARDIYKEKLMAELKEKFGLNDAPKTEGEAPPAEEEKKDADDEWEEDDAAKEADNQAEAQPPQEAAPAEETSQQKYDQALREDSTLMSLDNEVSAYEGTEREIRDRKTNKENDFSNIDKILNLDFGPDSRFAPLHGVEFKGDFGEYTYTFTPFGESKQGYTSLGNFASWKTPYSVLSFTGGVRCWGGPDRTVDVTLKCGKENKILEVREPSKCTYTMVAKTPFACTEDHLKSLRAKLPKGYTA